MKEKLIILIKHFLFELLNLFLTKNKEVVANTLLLVRLDEIGDYLLFRNYLQTIRESEKFNKYHITLVGNIAWKDLFLEFDYNFANEVVWLNKKKFEKDLSYRFKSLSELTSRSYEYTICPTFSRRFFSEDTVVRLVHSKYKWGCSGDAFNMLEWQKRKGDIYFTNMIQMEDKVMFEFSRNGEFINKLLGISSNLDRPRIEKGVTSNIKLPENYGVLFIGAGQSIRKWSPEKFAKVGMFIHQNYSSHIVICGGVNDKKEALEFSHYFEEEYTDLCGRTSLVELVSVFSRAKFLLSNDTSAPHFAVSIGMKNIFVLYAANTLGRFTPYPDSIAYNYHVIYHPEITKDLKKYKEISNKSGFQSQLNINAIEVKTVIANIQENLKIN